MIRMNVNGCRPVVDGVAGLPASQVYEGMLDVYCGFLVES